MSVYIMADLHLSFTSEKPMDIFEGWENYIERIYENWQSTVSPDDIVFVPGDITWAKSLSEAYEDFNFIDKLNGTKYLGKGNHDYWWDTRTKVEKYFAENKFTTLHMLHNSSVTVGDVSFCGSRGWLFENGEPHNEKIINRECGRIRMSLESAPKDTRKFLLLHYPPIYRDEVMQPFFDIMNEYGVERCYYGHIHGAGLKYVYKDIYSGVQMIPIPADYLKFKPLLVL